MSAPNAALERRIEAYSASRIPVLARSVATLAQLRAEEDTVPPRRVAQAVLRDPMLSLIVLRHLQTHHGRRKLDDISTVEHALMMLGLRRFFRAFAAQPSVEDTLTGRPAALEGLMQVVARSRAAAHYAGTFASLRLDLQSDKVVIAALLHDMAEMLLWCFDADAASELACRVREAPGLRSSVAQQQVLGHTLLELQLALARRWGLPGFIQSLMDDAQADQPRVQNVSLAVALSRHAAHGWGDPALPSDLAGISRLLGLTAHDVGALVFETSLRALLERGWYGRWPRGSFLPPLPGTAPVEASEATGESPNAYDRAQAWLRRLAKESATESGKGDSELSALQSLAAFFDGALAGLGFASGAVLVPRNGSGACGARFLAGTGTTAEYVLVDPAAGRAVARAFANGEAAICLGAAEGVRAAGGFAWPIVRAGGTVAVAVASGPRGPAVLAAEGFRRFRELGADLSAVLGRCDTAALLAVSPA